MTIISAHDISTDARLQTGVVVIGAGPAGIVAALEAVARGQDVILVETGNTKPTNENQQLSSANIKDVDVHAPVELTVSRQIGGTSSIWGGRCVPYDPIDFVDRPIAPDSSWPLRFEDVQPYYQRASDWSRSGRAVFNSAEISHLPAQMIPGLVDCGVTTSSLERWSLPTNFGEVYLEQLRSSANLRLVTDATCVQINLNEAQDRAESIECRTVGGSAFTINASDVIVAAGGLETTRLLMCSPGRYGKSLGDHSGHLGHWYMAHLEGVVADLVLATPAKATVYGYERDVDGTYVRRRFAFTEVYQLEHSLPNIAGWISNPELADASHGNAELSMTYLSLISPLGGFLASPAQRLSLTGTKVPGTPYGMTHKSSVFAHIRNIVRHPLTTAAFCINFGAKRVLSRGRKPPGFFAYSPINRYPFQYHAEHLPHYQSCVSLSADTDALGMRKLVVDIVFHDADIQGVIDAHRHWDAYLRASGVGMLEYRSDDTGAAIRERSGGGFHQVGTTRMAKDPADGVVDENLAVHGVPNVHIVSSSVFVTSGQANSTFLVVALAVRLIEHLYGPA
ncbi:choline dehydrogenase-like flavoprotein (plasmid) [Mycobacterium sp. JS623]|uniref:GMC oxidoreductase n=1 Tax=Mycobacterium sp. JS623 TaxID=212767 RepID=UPI0002A57CD0|nr:GMC family oxidoreductase [Mycobacterium sp. JS623]AGB26657.1 choline dehydrogenase-like flavoprotein [Mycobacterium sp. JS623]